MADFTDHPDYDRLSKCLRSIVKPKEYAWMTDHDRDRLVEDMCYPEPETEGPER